jgi:hypothetical protein
MIRRHCRRNVDRIGYYRIVRYRSSAALKAGESVGWTVQADATTALDFWSTAYRASSPVAEREVSPPHTDSGPRRLLMDRFF